MEQGVPVDPMSFISDPSKFKTKLLIDNEWVDSASGETMPCIDPSTGEEICRVQKGGAEDVDRAVKAAKAAFEGGAWRAWPVAARGGLLARFAASVEQNSAELAALESLDNGKPLVKAKENVFIALDVIRYYSGWPNKIEGKTVPMNGPFFSYTKREPVGVCG